MDDRRKVTRLVLLGLMVLGLALTGCVPEGDDDDEEDSRIPVVRYLV